MNKLYRNIAIAFLAVVLFIAILGSFQLFAWEAGLVVGLIFVGFPSVIYLIMKQAFGKRTDPYAKPSGWRIGLRRAAIYFMVLVIALILLHFVGGL